MHNVAKAQLHYEASLPPVNESNSALIISSQVVLMSFITPQNGTWIDSPFTDFMLLFRQHLAPVWAGCSQLQLLYVPMLYRW